MNKIIIFVIFVAFYSDIVWSQARTDQGREKETRWNKYKALTDEQKNSIKAVEKVCGHVRGEVKCTQKVGPSIDSEVSNCDRFCCTQGFLTGYCKKDAVFDPDIMTFNPGVKIVANCHCSNDWRDANCGSDGRFLGISCPVDRSACRRKCCRDGQSGGRCAGFLKLKCRCD